jgi:hypothetical protein
MPSDTEVVLGDNASFLCRFAGNPAPVTIWYFKRTNERAVLLATNSSRYLQSDERLTVLSVTEADNGLFICVGENIVGVQNFSAALMVLGKSDQNNHVMLLTLHWLQSFVIARALYKWPVEIIACSYSSSPV